ncbi:MAG: bifunctional acetate--CoA ligase family protein/GNAT family N-acetyltransferase [Candidatus Krumholzibacteria bacterium]|nr:bifunctional acetate--CoA ligase family protein/GNAT family N-acetyltransferase [Candidatus Krumholzibacteria bacterium]
MGLHYLHSILAPRSVAVVGATSRPGALGGRVFANLIEAGYAGELYAVNPNHEEVAGRPCFASLDAIGKPVDVAVVVTPAKSVPDLVRQCGAAGIGGAVVLSAGFREIGAPGRALERRMLDHARLHGVRIIGPNCLGVMRSSIGLNASFSHIPALRGDLALVSQSGALWTSILDWAAENHVGFSSVISMGASADVDFGEVLDYLAVDPETRSILLYIEGIGNARRFMSGLRVAARMKPVVVVKAGRFSEGSRAAVSHTGSLVGADDVFDAALRRAGAVRVMTIEQLFSAARILSSGAHVRGDRLAVVTNAGGPGVLAADCAVESGATIAPLDEATVAALDALLPAHWSRGNPVDILGDAPAQRYYEAVSACQRDPGIDGVLAMFVPQAMSDATESARHVVRAAGEGSKPTLACWLGESRVREARRIFAEERIPAFETPEASVQAFSYMAAYHRNQRLLMQVPGPLSDRSEPDVEGARMIIEGALAEGRTVLSTTESKALLAAFHIPTVPSVVARSPGDALVAAESVGFPVALKIHSHDVTHKSDVGGVRLGIDGAHAIRAAFNDLVAGVKRAKPDAEVIGVTVERMVRKPHGRELMVGVIRDPVFGPTVSFGAGGTAGEVMQDRSVALPPLNRLIIRDLVGRTRVARLLGAFRNMPPVDSAAIEGVLLNVSAMVCELPHIQELDINPLIADEEGAVAVDARVVVAHRTPTADRYGHMAIRPYASHLVSRWQLPDGRTMVMRPIRPEDAEIEDTFVRNLSAQSKYFRFMRALHELTPEMLVRFTQIDFDREMAFIATTEVEGREEEVAVGRYVTNPDGESCEFALVVGDDWRRLGIGSRIMMGLVEVAKSRGLKRMEGEILSGNTNMLSLVSRLGFTVRPCPDDAGVQEAVKLL